MHSLKNTNVKFQKEIFVCQWEKSELLEANSIGSQREQLLHMLT